jgi:hypothetical protein
MIFNTKMCIGNIKLVKILTLSIFLIKYGTSTSLSKDPQISRKNMMSYTERTKNFKQKNISLADNKFSEFDDIKYSEILTDIFIATKRYIEPNIPAKIKKYREKNLKELLEKLCIQDFGLPESVGFCAGKGCVRCYNIYQDKEFSLSLFRLPPNMKIPMHAHPKMEIFCKILFGSVIYRSGDLSDEIIKEEKNNIKKIINCNNKKTNKHYIQHVQIDNGNLHEITANSKKGIAFFDIIISPYHNNLPFFIERKDIGKEIVEQVECNHFNSEEFTKKIIKYDGPNINFNEIYSKKKYLDQKEKEILSSQKIN